jgi:hypothetical protein
VPLAYSISLRLHGSVFPTTKGPNQRNQEVIDDGVGAQLVTLFDHNEVALSIIDNTAIGTFDEIKLLS